MNTMEAITVARIPDLPNARIMIRKPTTAMSFSQYRGLSAFRIRAISSRQPALPDKTTGSALNRPPTPWNMVSGSATASATARTQTNSKPHIVLHSRAVTSLSFSMQLEQSPSTKAVTTSLKDQPSEYDGLGEYVDATTHESTNKESHLKEPVNIFPK